MNDKTQIFTTLGLMSGTSLDGVDAAFLETDGERIVSFGPSLTRPYSTHERDTIALATQKALEWQFQGPQPNEFAHVSALIHDTHQAAAQDLIADHPDWGARVDVIGLHGQTVLHHPPTQTQKGTQAQKGQTLQIANGQALADALSVPVVYDFRSADMAAGGQGAPLAPIYHKALATFSDLSGTIAVLNLGGVGNVSIIKDSILKASDTGPANGPLDSWIALHGRGDYDPNGQFSRAGMVDFAAIDTWLARDFFIRAVPRSADRYDFDVLDDLAGQSLTDGAATLAAFTALAVQSTLNAMDENPDTIIVCGGGRHNQTVLWMLQSQLRARVMTADDLGWDSDAVEAQAFGYLAVRRLKNWPSSFPQTTGVTRPIVNGVIAYPHKSAVGG